MFSSEHSHLPFPTQSSGGVWGGPQHHHYTSLYKRLSYSQVRCISKGECVWSWMHNLLPLYWIVYRVPWTPSQKILYSIPLSDNAVDALSSALPPEWHVFQFTKSLWINRLITGLNRKYEGNTPLKCGVCPNPEVLQLRTSCQRDNKEGVKWLCWNRKLLIKFIMSVGVNWWSSLCKIHFERDCVKRLHSSKKDMLYLNTAISHPHSIGWTSPTMIHALRVGGSIYYGVGIPNTGGWPTSLCCL